MIAIGKELYTYGLRVADRFIQLCLLGRDIVVEVKCEPKPWDRRRLLTGFDHLSRRPIGRRQNALRQNTIRIVFLTNCLQPIP